MILLLASILVIVIIIIAVCRGRHSVVALGHRTWNVSSGYDNSRAAAELLANVNRAMIKFMRHLEKKYSIDEVGPARGGGPVYKMVDFLLDNYNPEVFYENDPRVSSDTSYTIRKGQAMHICVRQKGDPTKLVDLNTMIFVILHECAHIANFDGWGHDDKFWTVFKFILREAVSAGVYEPVDYSQQPIDYCGLHVKYSPLFDLTLPDL